MESFSLLKYWRASSSSSTSSVAAGGGASSTTNVSTTTTTIASSASSPDSHTTEAAAKTGGGLEEEGGSFFDLEFASVPNEDESESISESDVEEVEANERQIFTSLVSLSTLTPATAAAAADTKSLHHSPVSLLKSATRLRVFALALNKKLLKSDANIVDSPKNSSSSNFFIEVFTGSRNNSSKSKAPDEDSTEERKSNDSSKPKAPDEDSTEERKFSKDVVHKYINSKIKPLYVRVSRRYGEMRFSGPLTAVSGNATTKKKKKKVMVKSRSAVAAVTSMPPVAAAAVQRRDDSLLQQEDGIQSAIAHCKKSFNASSKETKTLVVDEGEEIMV